MSSRCKMAGAGCGSRRRSAPTPWSPATASSAYRLTEVCGGKV